MTAKQIREEIRKANKPLLDIIALLNKNNLELTNRVKALEEARSLPDGPGTGMFPDWELSLHKTGKGKHRQGSN